MSSGRFLPLRSNLFALRAVRSKMACAPIYSVRTVWNSLVVSKSCEYRGGVMDEPEGGSRCGKLEEAGQTG